MRTRKRSQEAFLGPWPARTLESGLSIENLNGKSGLQSPGHTLNKKLIEVGQMGIKGGSSLVKHLVD